MNINSLIFNAVYSANGKEFETHKLRNEHFEISVEVFGDCINADKVGENDQSFGVLIEKNGTRVFLSGDMDNITGDEKRLAPEIGKVDLLKVGHHSYHYSSTAGFIRTLSPEYCVITNNESSVQRSTLLRIERIANSTILITGKENGIIAEIGSNGDINFFNSIHPEA